SLKVLLKKQHQNQIRHHLEGSAKSVFRLSVNSRMMLHIHLGHLGTLLLCQDWDKTMQFPIQAHILGYLCSVHAESATVVFQVHLSSVADDPVGDLGRNLPQ